jgi:hypothetical protein
MSVEEWRPIGAPFIDGYEVSDQGRVRSRVKYRSSTEPRILTARLCPTNGYLMTQLSRLDGDRGKRTQTVHSLVLLAFVGPRPAGHEVRHLDGNRQNNRLSNLAYGTPAENGQDQLRHGTHAMASRTHCKHGHEYTPENTVTRYWSKKGTPYRQCVTCDRARHVHAEAKKRAALAAPQAEAA